MTFVFQDIPGIRTSGLQKLGYHSCTIHSLSAWPVFPVIAMATSPAWAASDFAQASPLIWAACLLPSGQDGAGDRDTLAQCTPVRSCEVRGVNTPRGRTFGSGMKEPVHKPHPSSSGLTALLCHFLASWRGISLDSEACCIPCWLPLSYTSLWSLQETLVPWGVVPGCNSSPPEAALKSSCLSVVGGVWRGCGEETKLGGLKDSHSECCAWEYAETRASV